MRYSQSVLLSAILAMLGSAPAQADAGDSTTQVQIRVVETGTESPVEATLRVTYPSGTRALYRTDPNGLLERSLEECTPSVRIRVVAVGADHFTQTAYCDANPLEISLRRIQLQVAWSILMEPGTSVALEALGSSQITTLYGDLRAAMEAGETGTALSLSRELQALTADVPEFGNSFSALSVDLGLAELSDSMEVQDSETLGYAPAEFFFQYGNDADWDLSGKGSDYLAEFQRQFGLTASGVFDDQTLDFIGNELSPG